MTELAVAAGDHNALLFPKWLATLGVEGAEETKAAIHSQVHFPRLAGHDRDSIVDMVVRLEHTDADRTDLVFVEVKQEAGEGTRQLLRYAEHLAAATATGRKWLVYVTKYFDPKAIPLQRGLLFRQGQWHQFYRALKGCDRSDLNQEILSYMESTGQSQGNRFSPLDFLVIRNMGQTFGLMEAAMRGPVLKRIREITGHDSTWARLEDLPAKGQWVYQWEWKETGALVSAGFTQPESDDPQAYPCVSVGLYRDSKPFAGGREELRRAMRASVADGSWEGWGLDDSKGWFGMRRSKSLEALCGASDHVRACEVFMLEGLDAIDSWINAHPDLIVSPRHRHQSKPIGSPNT